MGKLELMLREPYRLCTLNFFFFLSKNVAIEPMESECDNPAGSLFICGCTVICPAPEEVGRILCKAHLNCNGMKISCHLCLSVKVRESIVRTETGTLK